MGRFRVWCPDDGEEEDGAITVTAIDAEEAAEFWAERYDAESASYPIFGGRGEPVVIVSAEDGSRSRFRLSGEAVPSYRAVQLTHQHPDDDA